MTELAGVRMASWKSELPNLGNLQPRSFVDAHYWIVGVGIREHLSEIGRFGRHMTIIDVASDDFHSMFFVGLPSVTSLARKPQEVEL